MATPNNGDTVVIDYTVSRTDGAVVGDTKETGPQTITLGQNAIFPQIEETLTGMAVGDQETVTVSSDKAFGPRREELLIDIPRANLPPEPAPEPGMALQAQQQDGSAITLYVVEVGDQTVKADGNHPLAGEDLTFGVTLREIKQAA
ncbi:peptidylprolyl isomerase [Porphyrobacter algicida]|uniref:Peptidyl-prolyl cis-trans isomerase n=1 Tax=Qipengyuania algicida TaxID=1836209 RepID=A0A845AIU3_9SPHN|nr:FKBP-type peptidyl-prolyl cis-trans isomerase [Qipengyuania algicida]MXP28765.1 peptidylprolyl isomerase [Qipengyuania algicida]